LLPEDRDAQIFVRGTRAPHRSESFGHPQARQGTSSSDFSSFSFAFRASSGQLAGPHKLHGAASSVSAVGVQPLRTLTESSSSLHSPPEEGFCAAGTPPSTLSGSSLTPSAHSSVNGLNGHREGLEYLLGTESATWRNLNYQGDLTTFDLEGFGLGEQFAEYDSSTWSFGRLPLTWDPWLEYP
jgi:hypothetical protein